MKHTLRKPSLLAALFFFSNFAQASLPMPDLPAEDFSYSCDFLISTQYPSAQNRFCEFKGTKTLKRSDGDDNWNGDINVALSDLTLKMESLDEGCPQHPFIDANSTTFSLMVSRHRGGMLAGQVVASASADIGSASDRSLSASASVNAPFKNGVVQVSTSLRANDFISSYRVSCKLNKTNRQ